MCGVFGFLDTQRILTTNQKGRVLRMLAQESEERGTDASGIAYNSNGNLTIYKRPFPAHLAKFTLRDNVNAVMGHTRQTTQGEAKNNYNNHPFRGKAGGVQFAFAHNGIISNDNELSRTEKLRDTNIKTDS